jgi:hypothetical protein
MTGPCPVCGQTVRLTARRTVRSHAQPDGTHCGGTHMPPGLPTPSEQPCPRPDKRRYATRQAADLAARRRPAIAGLLLWPYACPCGWWHLTKQAPARSSR